MVNHELDLDPLSHTLPERYRDGNSPDYLTIFPELLDGAILAHRHKNLILYQKFETEILKIQNRILQSVDDEIAKALSEELLNKTDVQIAILENSLTQIKQLKSMIEEKLHLEFKEGKLVSYPIPITIQSQIQLKNEEKNILSLLKSAHAEHSAKFHEHIGFIRQRLDNLVTANRAKIEKSEEIQESTFEELFLKNKPKFK
ncbi:hypothetical protein NEF87_001589 [Candidatus Lokiarchaeum ossiferum]|uniref:Uncharacterized protein n=1 Tax=Candidatus Lokiarchaeum ossiferum TaxID=2951803 RepID=A0ABY6HRW1_9ARCH|nr:hypothetical protein NEF87_001589 [Candidatus Lokiarchaeum sp. B-35]